jgi:hypothetical protein
MTTSSNDETAAIRGDIARMRGEMSRTVNEIEERLSPAHLKEQVANVTDGIKADVEHKVAELKESVKGSVIGGFHETKEHLRADLSNEFTHARAAFHDATVGRVEHMVHDARDTVTDAGTTVLDTIKANPIPAALIGVGLGWLIFGASRGSGGSAERTMRRYRRDAGGYGQYGYGGYGYAEGRDEHDFERGPRRVLRQGQRAVSHALHDAGQGAANLGHKVQEGASHLVDQATGAVRGAGEMVGHYAVDAEHRVEELAGGAREAATHLAQDARRTGGRVARRAGRQIRRAEQGVESTLRENPLALGAVAIAIGAAIGLSLPHTNVEDEWMGDAKDRLLHKAEDFAGEAIHKAEDAVGQLAAGEKSSDGKADKAPDTKNGLGNGKLTAQTS